MRTHRAPPRPYLPILLRREGARVMRIKNTAGYPDADQAITPSLPANPSSPVLSQRAHGENFDFSSWSAAAPKRRPRSGERVTRFPMTQDLLRFISLSVTAATLHARIIFRHRCRCDITKSNVHVSGVVKHLSEARAVTWHYSHG